jgi:hypothetical protein
MVTATRDGENIRSEADTQTEAWRAVAETAAQLVLKQAKPSCFGKQFGRSAVSGRSPDCFA